MAPPPHRFKVSLPAGDIVFNREVCLDLMTLNHRSVLHVVDRDTKLNSARFLKDETAENAWATFCEMWVSTYVGYPDIISADQGPQFRSKFWRDVAKVEGVDLKLSGVESHNAINVGEKYHDFLRRIFNKVKDDSPGLPDEDLLVLSIKALNDTAGPQGLVPTLLVFGVLPRIPFIPSELPTQVLRMKTMAAARSEMNKIVAKSRLQVALKSNVPGASSSMGTIKIGSQVLVYREKPINRWLGPFSVLDVDEKMCQVEFNGRQTKCSIDKVKLYRNPPVQEGEMNTSSSPGEEPSGNDSSEVAKLSTTGFQEPSGTEPKVSFEGLPPLGASQHPLDDPDVVDRWKLTFADATDGDLNQELQDLKDLRIEDTNTEDLFRDEEFGTHITKVLTPNDPLGNVPEFDRAKEEEVAGIKERDIWDIVGDGQVPQDANVLGGRFVLAYKNYGNPNQTVKARYVAQGHKDKDKGFVVHNVTTLRASSIRILVSVAAIKGFRIYSDDVRQAYLQNEHELTRDIYIRPKQKDRKFFALKDDEILKLKKPIYGVPDAGDYWDVTIHDHVKLDLKLIPLTGDPALYRKPNDEDVDGLLAVYVDDKAMAGNEEMQKLTEETAKKFESKPRDWDEFTFFGMHLKTLPAGILSIDQVEYISKVKLIPMDCTFEQFRSFRAVFAWIGLSRPDMACIINRAAQVTPKSFSVDKIRELTKGITLAKKTENRCLVYRPLVKNELHLRVYADASFANNDDLSTQMGYIILLCDGSNAAHILDYSSKKCKRVVRSVLGGEVNAVAESFDRAYMLRMDLESIFKIQIPLNIMTDSKSMFDVLTKSSSTTERRLMIDLRALQEAYKREEITQVGLVSSKHNLANSLTKLNPNFALERLLETGFDTTPVDQWIFRTKASSFEK